MGRPWPALGLARPRSRQVPTVQSGKPLFFEPVYGEIRLVIRRRLQRTLPVTPKSLLGTPCSSHAGTTRTRFDTSLKPAHGVL